MFLPLLQQYIFEIILYFIKYLENKSTLIYLSSYEPCIFDEDKEDKEDEC